MKKLMTATVSVAALFGSANAVVVTAIPDTTAASANALVDLLIGDGISRVGDAVLTGDALQFGTFTEGGTEVGFESGIVISTGDVNDVPGPNEEDGVTTVFGPDDVTDLIEDDGDTAIIEFDFVFDDVSEGTDIAFNYVFGSDEYNEFVGSSFIDEFQLLVDGENLALLPDDTVVNIDNVNNDVNSELYRDNDLDETGGPIDIELDGLTVPLLAQSADLGAGTFTALFVIADVGDNRLDSAVFIQAGTFDSIITPPNGEVPIPGALPLMLGGLAAFRLAKGRKA